LKLTEFVPPNFFSVAMSAPCRRAAFKADSPRMTFSFAVPPPGPRALLPILVTVSHSSAMMRGCVGVSGGEGMEGYEIVVVEL
jgi:hypothetical protein